MHTAAHGTDFLLLPEMAFAPWLAASLPPDADRWRRAIEAHDEQIRQLHRLGAAAVVGTRPVIRSDGSRRNQAYVWTAAAGAVAVHEKYYLPDEPGFWEATWYERGARTFEPCTALDATIGVQICTEMWFLEWARHYARAGAELLCVPRATPHESSAKWLAGGCATAVCSGAYCLSSNLWTPPGDVAACGGPGWIIDPDGHVLATTSEQQPYATLAIDLELARGSKSTYPRYVAE